MGKLQILPYVLVMLFPWFAIISYIDSPFGGDVMVVADLIILLILCVWCNKSAINGESNKKSVVMNLVTKIYYIRIVYRIFGFGAVPVICIFLTGFCNIGNCIRLYRDGSCKLFTSIILSIMGFVYGLDIISGIIQICLANKSKTTH